VPKNAVVTSAALFTFQWMLALSARKIGRSIEIELAYRFLSTGHMAFPYLFQ